MAVQLKMSPIPEVMLAFGPNKSKTYMLTNASHPTFSNEQQTTIKIFSVHTDNLPGLDDEKLQHPYALSEFMLP